VPGDVLLIPPSSSSFLIPCDAVLITGSCIVNESMLTGESTPTQKSALLPSSSTYSPEGVDRRHTLFSGTQVIQTRYYEGNKVACVVLRTGFNTLKGQLIHSILYPKQLPFKFYKDAIRFVTILFALATLGMAFSVYLYVQRGVSHLIHL
jgi:P-type E1-E2 ATPase